MINWNCSSNLLAFFACAMIDLFFVDGYLRRMRKTLPGTLGPGLVKFSIEHHQPVFQDIGFAGLQQPVPVFCGSETEKHVAPSIGVQGPDAHRLRKIIVRGVGQKGGATLIIAG